MFYQVKIHHEANFHITRLYGITEDPKTGEFMMVLEYAECGNLREYLKDNFLELKWKDKLEILCKIAYNLEFIHKKNYVHKNLHGGNILQFHNERWSDTKIADLGLAQSINNSNSSNIYGVLPYIAPEVLGGKPYTFASDIYSFGIIMMVVSIGEAPYRDIPHDEKLALEICNGRRPKVAKGTPKCYNDFVDRCLDADPGKRPSAEKVLGIIRNWLLYNEQENPVSSSKKPVSKKEPGPIGMYKEFIVADEIPPQEFPGTDLHPEAIYVSRSMTFPILVNKKI